MTTLARYQGFALDDAGNVLASPTVEVRDEGTAALVPLFSDRAGTTGIGNPFTGGSDGFFAFHIAGGAYKITVTKGGTSRIFRYVGIGTSSETDVVVIPGTRTMLAADATYYVRADGNDSNTGLVNNSGGAFLTVQKAINVIRNTIDLAGFKVTIQVADGTYTAGATLEGPWVGGQEAANNLTAMPVVVTGNAATPANVHFNVTGSGFVASHGGMLQVQNLKITSTNISLHAAEGGRIYYGNIVFGTATTAHLTSQQGSNLRALSSYSIIGGAAWHSYTDDGSYTAIPSITVTLSGTPAFSNQFVITHGAGAALHAPGITFSGSATGTRYLADLNSCIDTGGGGANYFPGNVAGSTSTGGQYI